jgi:signal transduction histidine kinase
VVYRGGAALATAVAGSDRPLLAVVAGGAVAVAFAPVRFGIQRVIERRLFGTGGDPRVVFHQLGARLAASTDPESLMAAVVETATESLRLRYAAVQLRSRDGWQTVQERGQPAGVLGMFEMFAGAEVVGRLVVSPRPDAKVLSPADQELLAGLASHSGVAARVAGLVTALRMAQQRLLVAREAERHRIHRDLHDTVGPSLVGLTLQLEVAAELAEPSELGPLVSRLHSAAARATEDVRRIVRDLRPAELDELGLPAAVAAAAARLDSPTGPRFELDAPLTLPTMSRQVEDAAYKICLEAMNNVVRHSGATRCSVRIGAESTRAIAIQIIDDGHGLDADATIGTGLESMRERAEAVGGWLRIAGAAGGGTRLDASLPTST